MKKSLKTCILAVSLIVSLSLILSACAPGQYSNSDDTRPKVAIFDAPNGSQVNGLKKVLYAVLNANDATQPFNVLSTNRTDYYETNGSITGAQAEYYGSVATRRIGSDLGVFVHAPVLERRVYTETKEEDKNNDGFLDVGAGKRLILTKLQLEVFILDPVTAERVATYSSHVYESRRIEKSSRQLVLTEQDPDVWKMANIALKEFSTQVAQDLVSLSN